MPGVHARDQLPEQCFLHPTSSQLKTSWLWKLTTSRVFMMAENSREEVAKASYLYTHLVRHRSLIFFVVSSGISWESTFSSSVCLFGDKLKKYATWVVDPFIFLITLSEHALTMVRFRTCALQWKYSIFGNYCEMMPRTPTLLLDMLLAPSSACPRQSFRSSP